MYTHAHGTKRIDLPGNTVLLDWDLKDFPESEPYYSVKHSFEPPDYPDDAMKIMQWMENMLIEMSVLYNLGFEIDVLMPEDGIMYWRIDELPWK